jgi:hypothetical protein
MTMKKLIHFSDELVKFDPTYVYEQRHIYKPKGLWISDESEGCDGWKQWCTGENFRLEDLRFSHEVVLKEDNKVKIISSPYELLKFSLDYRDEKECGPFGKEKIPDCMLPEIENYLNLIKEEKIPLSWDDYFPDFRVERIDCERLYQEYQGLFITPYIPVCRLSMACNWYYTWDCASGVIWDLSCIEKFECITEYFCYKCGIQGVGGKNPTLFYFDQHSSRKDINLCKPCYEKYWEIHKNTMESFLKDHFGKHQMRAIK